MIRFCLYEIFIDLIKNYGFGIGNNDVFGFMSCVCANGFILFLTFKHIIENYKKKCGLINFI